jgi:hypothetical protein
MQQNESKLQANIVRWFSLAYPKYERMLFAIENKRRATPIQGARLKQQGIKAGVPDLCLALPTQNSGALYIELKFGKNKQTAEQKEFEIACNKFGNCYELIYTFDDAVRLITSYINSYNEFVKKK